MNIFYKGVCDPPFISHPPGVSTTQTQQAYTSQVLKPEDALYLYKKKKRPLLHDPYACFSALLYRQSPQEDQKAIMASMDNLDPDHATLLWKPFRTSSLLYNMPNSKIKKLTTCQINKAILLQKSAVLYVRGTAMQF